MARGGQRNYGNAGRSAYSGTTTGGQSRAVISAHPPASTVSFTAAQFNQGWVGTTDTTSIANYMSLYAYQGNYVAAVWAGRIYGTDAYLTIKQNTNSAPAGMVEVSVDGGAYAAAAVVSGEYVLFTGLSNGTHTVTIRINGAYSGSCTMPTTGNVLRVTGMLPSLAVFGSWTQVQDTGTSKVVANAVMNTPVPGGFVATTLPKTTAVSVANVADNGASLAVRGDFSTLAIVSDSRYVYVSTDGASPVQYDLGTNLPAVKVISGLSGTHTYYCWQGANGTATFAVGGQLGTGIANIATKKRLHQFGTSITATVPGDTSTGVGDVFRVGAALGRAGGNFGVPGNTIAQIRARILPTVAALAVGVTSNDVAVLEAGRNDVATAPDGVSLSSAAVTAYTQAVNDLISAGYGLILCRGITPGQFPECNAQIQGVVNSINNPKVKYVATSTWTGITTLDGVHPDDPGFTTLGNYAIPAYQALGA